MKRIFASLIAVVLLLIGLRAMREESHAAMLRKDYATTHGVISSKKVGSHGVVEYTYEVGGTQFHGQGNGSEEKGFGQTTTVYYSPSDPSVSSLYDPRIHATLGWSGAVMPFIIALAFVFIAARRSQPQTE